MSGFIWTRAVSWFPSAWHHYLETGSADARPGPGGGEPAPVPSWYQCPIYLHRCLEKQGYINSQQLDPTQSALWGGEYAACEPSLQTTPIPLPLLHLHGAYMWNQFCTQCGYLVGTDHVPDPGLGAWHLPPSILSTTLRQVPLSPMFGRWGNWGSKRLCDLPKVIRVMK